jgi:hypothetical protein
MKDWLCIVEFLATDNPEARLFAADIIGYLVGYANLTNIAPSKKTSFSCGSGQTRGQLQFGT